jgi:hypothetical protein
MTDGEYEQLPEIDCGAFIYTGPFPVSCDHGCYHDPKAIHGASFGSSCTGATAISQQSVHSVCINGVRTADFVFAYLDEPECYGAILEIGVAQGLGKRVYLHISDWKKLYRPYWLAARGCRILSPVNSDPMFTDPVEAFDYTLRHFQNSLKPGLEGARI